MKRTICLDLAFIKGIKRFWVFLLLLILFGCKSQSSDNQTESVTVEVEEAVEKRTFKMVELPITITSPEGRAEFLVNHYWDNFDFKDTTYINLPEVTEQAFVDFITFFPYVDKNTSDAGITKNLRKAEEEPRMFEYFLELYDKYLYDPNSPMRNEEYYIPVLEYLANSDKISDLKRDRANYRLELLLKNRVGDKAINITYTLKNGKTGDLYSIRAPYTLLMFYNPDCHTCAETTQFLKSSPVISELVKNRILTVLAFYPDEDLTIWEKHLSGIPDAWINGYDKNQLVEKNRIYDLKAIPTLYLLDSDKQILLKDATAEDIERYLWENNAADYH